MDFTQFKIDLQDLIHKHELDLDLGVPEEHLANHIVGILTGLEFVYRDRASMHAAMSLINEEEQRKIEAAASEVMYRNPGKLATFDQGVCIRYLGTLVRDVGDGKKKDETTIELVQRFKYENRDPDAPVDGSERGSGREARTNHEGNRAQHRTKASHLHILQ